MKILSVFLTVLLLAVTANAAFYSFEAIQDDAHIQAVEGQFWMEVTANDPGDACITITNAGPLPSSIKGIYFDAYDELMPPVNLQIESLDPGPNVAFKETKNPKNLPAGNNLIIAFETDESAVKDGSNANSIDPGEFLTLNMSFTEPPWNIFDLLNNGNVRVGLHVGSLNPNDDSGSYVNVIPEPGSGILLGAVSASFLFIRKKIHTV